VAFVDDTASADAFGDASALIVRADGSTQSFGTMQFVSSSLERTGSQ
jgi:hypothetical protein